MWQLNTVWSGTHIHICPGHKNYAHRNVSPVPSTIRAKSPMCMGLQVLKKIYVMRKKYMYICML